MPAVAVDIGTYTIKAIHAKPGEKPEIIRVVEQFNEMGISVPADDFNMDKMAAVINSLFDDHNLPRKDVRLSLPEQVVSTKIISIPRLSDAELASAIGWQAEQYIPIPLEDLALEYQVLYRPKKDKKEKMQVLLVGVKKSVVEKYVETFIMAGIEPTLLETQMISLVRSFNFSDQDPSTLVASMGATTLDLAVIRNQQLAFVFSHLNGGQLLTKTIQQNIGLDPQQAEQYKREYGLDESKFEGKIAKSLYQPVEIIVNEMLKAFQFFSNTYPGESISRVLLSGGTALLPDFVEHVTGKLGVEVLVAAPFTGSTGEIPESNRPEFSVCMGLIMKDI